MCLTLRSVVQGWSLFYGLKLYVANSDLKRPFQALQNRCLWLELETDVYSRGTRSYQGPVGGTWISIKLGLDFNQVGTNSAMTRVLVLTATVWRNERLKCVVVVDFRHWYYVWGNFWLKKMHMNKVTSKFQVLLISIFLHVKNLHCLYTSLDLVHL